MDAPVPKLADLLRHPDDLDKIANLKSDFGRKKAAVDAQLRSGLREQLETTQSGLSGLSDGQKTVQAIKDELAKIDRLCSESQNMIRDFASINVVSQAHRNFGAVEAMRRNLETFNDRLAVVERWLQEDDDDAENMPNLLPCHYELTQLRNIRDDAMEQIGRSGDMSLQATLEDYFDKLDGTIAWFDEHVGLLAINLINLVVAGNDGLVVRFALIMETEDKSDQRVLALQEALRDHREMAARFQSITDGAKTVRGYKDKFLQAIRVTAQDQFAEAREQFLDDPSRLERYLKWFFNDLNAVKVGMISLVPKHWKILKTYVDIFHQLMHDWLVALIDDPESSSVHTLEIVGWPERYYKKMDKLGFRQEDLTPHVIDSREAELVREFRQLIIKMLDEWIERIFAQEQREFAERAAVEGAHLDRDYEYLRTRNMIDLWRMMGEQIDAAANSKRTDVVEGVVDAMFVRLRSRQAAWQRMLEDEIARYESSKSTDTDGFQTLQDWLVASANDQIACVDDNEDEGQLAYLSTFRRKFDPAVSPQFADHADTEVTALRDSYLDFASWCLTQFATLVFTVEIQPVLAIFFTPKWYSSAAMTQIRATLEDYVNDFAQILHHSVVELFIEILANELLVRYLSSVRTKGARFKRTDPFHDKIFDDISTVFEYFETLDALAPGLAYTAKQTWRVTEPFLALITCDRDAVADTFEAFKRSYWDLQISWVEAVLRARDDFERSMLNDVKARAAQMDVVRGPETIMSKIR
jgi:exocyst complex component 3